MPFNRNAPDPYQQEYERQRDLGSLGPTYGSNVSPQYVNPNPNPNPGPGPGGPAPGVYATPQEAYQAGRRDERKRLTTPRMTGYRVACGICWALWTVLLVISAFVSFANGSPIGILALLIACLTGWYDFRIWTLKARYLTILFII